ncbi:contactin-associated protein-like 4 [Octopus sinensis]|uniref:Contactin-associated protein-like 4 n=1 Tax=Octopus sinensis TaxID=2607531 RepID=A0A7E6EK83_9MOLL|nr:contactin-associated protein-like 4 [Octopus sinensis]
MDINTGGFAVSLDSYTSQQGELKAFEPLIRQNALQWEHLPSSIYYGGTDVPQSSDFISFIGCLKDLMYENSDGDYIHVPIEASQNVTEGCHHQCDEEENPCQHNSTCINHYDHVTCECFGTDYEGELCEKEGVTKITLRGYEWLTYQLYIDKLDPAIQIARVSMEFKTERNTGILLYAVGGSPTYSHIIALLNSGFVNVSISSDNVDYDFSISVEMDKDRLHGWHNLTLVHQGPVMYVHLDDKTVQKTVQNYLNLDPHVYFGGGKNFVKTKGLEVTQNFIGCLRNIYFNDKSILYDLRYGKGSTQYHGGTAVSYGCNSIRNIPLSFPRVGTMLTLENPVKDDLDIQLEFRTIKDTAVLLYATLSTFNSLEGHDIGTLQVLLSDGHPELVFVPLRKKQNITQTITFDHHVNDNLWHSLNLTFRNRVPSLTIDGVTLNAVPYDYQKVELKSNIIIGYDFSVKMGFMGCIRNVYLQDKAVDLITIVQSAAANGPQLDGCPLEDFCQKRMICEHNSKCVSDWRDMHCDCSGTGYEGETCHFAKHRQNCNDYYLAGKRKSGVYPADLDGNGPLPPTYITCDMQSKKMVSEHEAVYGVTMVTHNLNNNYTVQSEKLPDLKITISYREMSKKHLALLASQSAFCEQKIEYQCYDMPIRLGSSIWFKTAKEVIVKAMGTDTVGACSCSLDYSCSNNYNKCNCDQRQGIWQKDSGVIQDKEQVPITDIYAERHENIPHGIGTVSLGPLKCWGDRVHQQVKAITFKSRESYLQSPAWTYEDLHFSFRTFNDQALLVYQTDGNGSHIVIKLESGNTIKFEALLGKNLTEITLRSDTRVDDGQWHIVKLEHDNYNIRMTFGMKRELRKFTSKLLSVFPSDVYMYIGGAPSDLKHVATLPGLAGCIRDLVYNNQIVKLDLPGIQRVGEIYPGCIAACERGPCQNGGRCVELWGSYDCICENKWSHLGFDCDQNIDKDTVTFTGKEDSFLFFDKTQRPSVMDETIVVSFRTRKMDALLLYLYDNFNNFVQLELQEEKKIILTFNSFSDVRTGVLEYPEILNDENWHQVIVEKVNKTYRIQIGQSSVVVFHLRLKKTMEPLEKKVSVVPPTPNPSKKFVHLYVGGVPFPDTQVPNLAGCIRGLKIGRDVFYLRKASRNKASVKKECKAGCGINPCLNDGHCTNLWGNKEIFCDCSISSFTGRYCTLEPCGEFRGDTILQYKFDPIRYAAAKTDKEKLFVSFATNVTGPGKYVLVDVYSTTTDEQIILTLEPDKRVSVETDQGVGFCKFSIFPLTFSCFHFLFPKIIWLLVITCTETERPFVPFP